MHIALTGASGFIGSFIARRLHESGHTVSALVRDSSRRDHIQPYVARFVEGGQSDRDAWPALLDGADAMIHNSIDWAPIRGGDLETHLQTNLVDAIALREAAGRRLFVYVSSVAVHHDMRPRWQGRVDEDHPTRPGTIYGACKAAVEAHLWSSYFHDDAPFASIRPCAVYGIDPNLSRSIGYPIISQLKEGTPYTRSGGGKFVHVEDVAATVTAILSRPDIPAAVYNLADCYARWADWAQMAAELLGIEASIDLASPAQSKNMFTKDAVQALGVSMDRGFDGIRAHLAHLIELHAASGSTA
jgi:nucleoside-diphosphate-sugar epimerase